MTEEETERSIDEYLIRRDERQKLLAAGWLPPSTKRTTTNTNTHPSNSSTTTRTSYPTAPHNDQQALEKQLEDLLNGEGGLVEDEDSEEDTNATKIWKELRDENDFDYLTQAEKEALSSFPVVPGYTQEEVEQEAELGARARELWTRTEVTGVIRLPDGRPAPPRAFWPRFNGEKGGAEGGE